MKPGIGHPSSGRLKDKIALVTGAASGIGRATAELFCAEGARVVLTDRNVAGGEAAAAAIGESAVFLPHDVTREQEWIDVVDETVRRFGRLDALVNNAGIGVVKDIEQTTLEEWRMVNAVNVEGVFLGCKNAVRVMKGTGGGSIVNLSSVAALVGAPDLPAYCASKAAVRLLSKSVALHCARAGYKIRCNSVHPSFIATPMVEAMIGLARSPDKMRDALTHTAPLGHLGETSDVAFGILYLASDESKFVTGTELVIDGGTTAR